MTKDECLDRMISLGYDAYMDDGCVMIAVDHPLTVKEHKKLEKVFKSIGHNHSWGWKVKRGDNIANGKQH